MFVQIRRIAYLICALTAGASIFAHPALAQEAKPVVTFNKDVLPILQKNCNVPAIERFDDSVNWLFFLSCESSK